MIVPPPICLALDSMPSHVTIPISRAWNTWSSRPGEMVFLPLGVKVTPLLYSTKARSASPVAGWPAVTFGRHALDGGQVELEVEHAGTRLALDYRKPGPFDLVGRWNGLSLGEWGLRFWVSICLSAEPGTVAEFIPERGAALVKVGHRYVALVCRDRPIQITGHDDFDALRDDFEAHGYFHKGSRSLSAPLLALRFNLEMMRSGDFAASVADDALLAIAQARRALEAPALPPRLPVQQGRYRGALEAVRDVIGWNTLWDQANARPYTCVSRIWNLGTFAVWYNDQTYAAMLSGLFDAEIARENLATSLASATPQGNFACIVTSNDAWVDRTQSANGALMVWLTYLRTRDRSLLALAFPALARNQRWWRSHRDPDGRGLVSCGTSDVGEALYKGTHFGARNETGMDNSAMHDEAVYDPATGTLDLIDVGLNATLALDAEMLALIAAELGRDDERAEFSALAAASRDKIATGLWDETRGIFANRKRTGAFVRSLAPTSFYPLICGAATEAQAARLVDHLADPATFGGDFVIPNATRDDPAFADNVYWRGRIWPPVNYFVWLGLRRYGFVSQASALAEKSYALFAQSWFDRRICAENYSALTGEAMDQPDTDPFYTWGAMLPLLGVAEICDINPWDGWTIHLTGEDFELGPFLSPVGEVTLRAQDGCAMLEKGRAQRFATDFIGRLRHLRLEESGWACEFVPARKQKCRLRLPGATQRPVAAKLDDADAVWQIDAAGLSITLDFEDAPRRLSIFWPAPR
jgi:putative isomerase